MSETGKPENATAADDDLPERIIDAVRRAVRAAVREHKLLGNPISGRRNGKIVTIPPEEIEI